MIRLLALVMATASGVYAGTVAGAIVDARGGEALANVAIQLGAAGHATSDSTGHFSITSLPAGDYVLSVSTVGYHAVKRAFHLEDGETKQFEIVLSVDGARRTDTVEVSAGPFDTARQDSPSTLTLAGNDIKNLASVLADDPLRAVQSLPGVTSNNDFDARFSLRGADYNHIGLYLDNVLLHEPFHMLAGQSVTGSGAAFNGDMVENWNCTKAPSPSASKTAAQACSTCIPAMAAAPAHPSAARSAFRTRALSRKARSEKRRGARGWWARARAICNTSSAASLPQTTRRLSLGSKTYRGASLTISHRRTM